MFGREENVGGEESSHHPCQIFHYLSNHVTNATCRVLIHRDMSDVRWISIDSVSTWLDSNRAGVLSAEAPGQKEAILFSERCMSGGFFLHALQAFARESKAVFVSLQSLTTVVSEQRNSVTA